MKKFGIFILIMLIMPVSAGLYGIIHDQVSFTISPEYFTKYKFVQFQIAPNLPNRVGAIIIGWSATWWTGVIIGLGLGLTGFIHKGYKTMLELVIKSAFILLIITIMFGIAGIFLGIYVYSKSSPDWYFPQNLLNKTNFIIVGTMHDFSYLGGFIGLLFGIFYLIIKKRKIRRKTMIEQPIIN